MDGQREKKFCLWGLLSTGVELEHRDRHLLVPRGHDPAVLGRLLRGGVGKLLVTLLLWLARTWCWGRQGDLPDFDLPNVVANDEEGSCRVPLNAGDVFLGGLVDTQVVKKPPRVVVKVHKGTNTDRHNIVPLV